MAIDQLDTSVFSDKTSDGVSLARAAKPWARFWARTLDLNVGAMGFGFVIGVAFPSLFETSLMQGPFGNALLAMLIMPFSLIGDAVSNAVFGNTLGKLIVGLKIEPPKGRKLSLGMALRRNLFLYPQGLACGVPLANLAAYVAGYNRISEGKSAIWDKKVGSRVVEKGAHVGRTVVAATLVLIISLGGIAMGALGAL